MQQYVIYEKPLDYPQGYVVRCWHIGPGLLSADKVAMHFSTLDAARAAIPPGLFMMPRKEGDDPAICEVWL